MNGVGILFSRPNLVMHHPASQRREKRIPTPYATP
jgi:hypothetical protein